jgi:ABC-type uncharacterized transport system substrate-binding protein
MLKLLKHLWLGVALIAITSGILLFSDLGHRKHTARKEAAAKMTQIAIMQIASTQIMDDMVAGMDAEFRIQGFIDGKNAVIRHFNASGDYSTATTMAKDIVAGDYDIIVTTGTPTLQTMASANKDGRKIHVFGGVTDPYGSGVGITGPNPDQHPAHLAGIGTFQPVENAIDIAKRMNPALKRIGTVWNPTEHNSEACVKKARAKCKALGITLVEANAGNTSEVPEALRSVLTRDVDIIWIGGDIVATASASSIIDTSRKAGVPVFTNSPSDAKNGALFGLGASYVELGHIEARIACRILHGEKPSTMRVDNVVPERFAVSRESLAQFKTWKLDAELTMRASSAAQAEKASTRRAPEPGKVYKVGIVYVTPHKLFDQTIVGIRKGFADNGFVEGRNLDITIQHANGDMSIIQQIATNAAASDRDLIFALSTPGLGAVCGRVKDKPVVFAEVTEPVGVGAGKSFTDHLPNVTGAVAPAPLEGGFAWLMKLYPNIKRIGMIYTPSEPNVVTEVTIAKQFAQKYGFELILRTANNPSEVPEAMNSLMSENLDAFFYEGDNSIMSAEPLILENCRKRGIPVLGDDDSEMGRGSLLACGVSPRGNGYFGAQIASRVLLGENPAKIPFTPSNADEISIDISAAKRLGITFPTELIKEAAIIHGIAAVRGRPVKIAVINLSNASTLETAEKGFFDGLENGGLAKEDYEAKVFNAQGDASQLPQMIDAAVSFSPDVIVSITTPAAIALANRKTNIPTVFTVCTNPKSVGFDKQLAGSNMTGVYEDTPVMELLDLACRRTPGLSKVGIIYNPSEINSQIAVKMLRDACRKSGIGLVEKTVSTTNELPEATRSMTASGVGAILTAADNTLANGIVAVVKTAGSAGIPVYATDPALVKHGVTAAIGNDYADWGAAAARMTLQILAGLKPSDLPPAAFKELNEEEGVAPKATTTANKTVTTKHFNLAIVSLNDSPTVEESVKGILDGLAKSGLKQDRDFSVRAFNAQSDMSTLISIMATIRAEQPDLLFCTSTPVLQVAVNSNLGVKTVFTSVASGVKAGAGKSETDHNPNFTGITTRSMFDEMAATIHATLPNAKRVGTICTPSEVNSVLYCDLFSKALAKYGMELLAVPVTNQAEASEAVTAAVAKNPDVFCQIADNTSHSAYAFIARKALEAHIPLYAFESMYSKVGASITLARDYYDAGVECGTVGAQVLGGADIAGIPFSNTRSHRFTINLEEARKNHLNLPSELLAKADIVINLGAAYGHPAKIAILNMADNQPLAEAQKGVIKGLADKGLVEGKDFVAKIYNGHGDFSLYPQVIETAVNEKPDLVVLIGTPLIQTGAKKNLAIPTVFTVSSEPASCGIDGAVKAGWLTGVYLNTPVDELVTMTMRRCPGIKKVGIIFNPGEYISNEAVKRMRVSTKKHGLELVERSVNSVSEAPEAARALVSENVGAILTSCDSIMNAAMPAVVKVTGPYNIPVFANELEQVHTGATAAIGYSFEDWGRATGKMAALILSGAKPSALPPEALGYDYLREVEPPAPSGNKTTLSAPVPAIKQGEAAPHAPWKLRVVAYAENSFTADIYGGIRDGLKAEGLAEGRDYVLRYQTAQGDMATLSSIMQEVSADEADLMFDIATPPTQAGVQRAPKVKQVYAGVADGIAAGAGKSAVNHYPFITGIDSPCDFADMIRVIRLTKPSAKRIGTLYAPAESNSLFYKTMFEKLLSENGMELVTVPVNASTEVGEAAATLCTKKIDLVCQMLDNTTHPAFALIAKRAKDAGLATYSFDINFMQEGATLVIAYDFRHTGAIAAAMGVDILRGSNPADMPFAKDKATRLAVNMDAARALGIAIPDELARQAVRM